MNPEQTLFRLCEPVLSGEGYELVLVEVAGAAGRRTARFFIDKPGGVTLEDCSRASRLVDPLIDENQVFSGGPYVLEVSSPGLERPLVKPSDYERFAGRKVRVKLHRPLDGRKKFTGTLQGMSNGKNIVVEVENNQLAEIPLETVSRANLVHEW
ncbi:MAG: ribosome maturation factor RimP [Candidatus Glassbacteria bacterium]|nr:ribosome maturation factor RimP [Candidatus Glassbacteria bacterium]